MKKILTFIFVALLPLVANAYDAEINGICYNFWGSEATVTYRDDNYNSYSGAIVIPESVTYNGKTYSVTSIGNNAFYNCSGLASINIPNSVTTIGIDAFYYCRSLTTVTIPEGVTSIGNYAFWNCISLTSITIPNSVTSIGEYAFLGCSGLTSITISESITSIGDRAFSGCTGLTSIKVAEGNTTYDSRNDCNAIIETATNTLVVGCQNTTIPEDVTSIGTGAFSNCSSLTSITIPNIVTSIGDSAFANCSGLTSITIPNSVTNIGSWAFQGCRGLTSVTIPGRVTSIGNMAFANCISLTSVTIGNSVTNIGDHAFEGCRSMTSVTIPSSVTSIGIQAFQGCRDLTSIKVAEGNTTYDSRNDCNAIIETATNTLIVGCQNTTIPEDVTSIGQSAFGSCIGLTSITIPESVTSIDQHAFSSCTGLISVTIGNSVTCIGYSAFSWCSGLTSVTIPEGVTSIGEEAFNRCSNLTSVIVDRATPLTITTYTFSNRANAALYVPYGSKSAYEAADEWKDFKEIVEINTVNVGGTGFATYCSPKALDFSGITDIKVYIASDFDPDTYTLTLTRVTEAPTGEGLYIVGKAGTYVIPEASTDAVYSNLLKGVTYPITISPTDGDYTNFILANGSHGVGFYSLSEAGELAAGKAYLQLPTASVSEVKAISVIFDDDEDAVLSIEEDSQTQRIYNLQGQKVSAPKSGLYIINGKKVFIK